MTPCKLTNPEVALLFEDLPDSIRQDAENAYKVAFVLLLAVSVSVLIVPNVWMNESFIQNLVFVNIYVLLRHRRS